MPLDRAHAHCGLVCCDFAIKDPLAHGVGQVLHAGGLAIFGNFETIQSPGLVIVEGALAINDHGAVGIQCVIDTAVRNILLSI